MSQTPEFEKCASFITCQMQLSGRTGPGAEAPPRRVVTISRQTGCGAHAIAMQLAEYLQAHDAMPQCNWAVFDRNLVQKVLEDHHLPAVFEKYMAEDKRSEIAEIMDELFGLHPSSWSLVHRTAETILRLAQLGNVIIIGRGANIITSSFKHAVHVRLVGSLEKRVERVCKLTGMERNQAIEFVQREDLGRKRYLKAYFDADIDDPMLYHMIVNTDLVPFEIAVRMIGDAVLVMSNTHAHIAQVKPARA